jgi:CheY-like chemotaxis protein
MLEAEGWEVREAENGELALQRMEEELPRLVLLDLMMPEMDGFEFTEQVRLHPELRAVPIVVVTSHDLSREERQRLNGYVETIVQKAGDAPDALLHRVRELLGGFSAERPMIPRRGERRALPA